MEAFGVAALVDVFAFGVKGCTLALGVFAVDALLAGPAYTC
jgi:hypothetical protein